MKRISALLAAGLLATTLPSTDLHAQEGEDLLRTPRNAAPFALDRLEERRGIRPGIFSLTEAESQRLLHAVRGATLRLPSLDAHLETSGKSLEFRRYEPFAPGARVLRVSKEGVVAIDPRERHYFIAGRKDEGVGIAVDPKTGEIDGFAARGDSRVELSGFTDIGVEVTTVTEPAEGSSECTMSLDDQPTEIRSAALSADDMPSQTEAPQGTTVSFQAVVAIDTDTEWMSGKGNNTTTAMNWITDLFLAMNVFYERDVETRLLIGDVYLRIDSDPYSVPSNRSDQLDEFGAYWMNNMSTVDRAFATMLSGRGISGGSFSGIAWLDQYCKKGSTWGTRTPGSYNYNAIGSSRTAATTALFVGHEIGHNMGSPHTHCYAQPVDQCYNAESGCYTGAPSCPSGGKGTVMSYCHMGGSSGAGCGTSNQEFHPTVQSLLENRLAQNSPSCIAPFTAEVEEIIMTSSFESP